ncbi:MAG: transposase [Maribacter sp.]|nr:transposase [Maribacter sp.]
MPNEKTGKIKASRNRKFNPKIFFFSLLYLITGKNNEGYGCALNSSFDVFGKLLNKATSSAFTQIRKRVSFVFIKNQFLNMTERYEKIRPTFKGMYIYSVDGDQYNLPRTRSLMLTGFCGYPVTKTEETHLLKMYSVLAIDPITGVPLFFEYSHSNDEIGLAIKMIKSFAQGSLGIFDRLYLSKRLLDCYHNSGKFFLCRCKTSSTFKEIVQFCESNLREQIVTIENQVIRLVKAANPKTGEDMILATNLLDKVNVSIQELNYLYFRRWESEIVNKDMTDTQKLEQFHSTSLNGILQEIFMHFWIMAFTKMEIAEQIHPEKDFCQVGYVKSNFKECLDFVIKNIPNFFVKKQQRIYKKFKKVILSSLSKRKHHSRSNPRQVKSSKTNSYKKVTLVPRTT